MNLEYFNLILDNKSLHNWFSDYIFNRLGVQNKVEFKNNEFIFLFYDNSKQFAINFKSNGRSGFFELKKSTFFVVNNHSGFVFDYSQLLPKNGLACYGVSSFDWFIDTPTNDSISFNYDFASYAIWALNRVEELDIFSSEKHNRFQIFNSHLNVNSMYLRPIVDEWFLFILNILKFNGFLVKSNSFNFSISHDIDTVSRYKEVPIIHRILKMFKDLLFNYKILFSYFKNPSAFVQCEHSNNLETLMYLSDSINVKSKFYFIVGNSSFRYDYRYYISSNFILNLIKKIISKGHEVGIHYSYNSSKKRLIRKEWLFFSDLCRKIGYRIEGGRMHYLRIDFLKTLSQLADAGQNYDNTLTFHEYGGFRCGTCFAYKPFNLISLKMINIEVRPLILMDDSLLNYMNSKDVEKTFEYVKNLIDSCWDVNGTFSILWHNSNLDDEFKLSLYKKILMYSSILSKKA
jgi:hypothetical protein